MAEFNDGTIIDGNIDTPNDAGDQGAGDQNANDQGDQGAADDGNGDQGAADQQQQPQDDWRARMAGEDKKLLGFLGRYPSEKAFVEAAKKDRDTLFANKTVKLPDNPTAEEVAAYRKANGIPDEATGYFDALGDLTVGDDDKPIVEQFLSAMHETNAPPALVKAAVSTYYQIVEEQQAAEADADRVMQSESIEALREEWGPDYKRNLNAMHNYLETLPETVRSAFTHGRGADGRPLGFNADVVKWLAGKALEENPLATVVPASGQTSVQAVDARIAEIEGKMGNRNSEYWRGPQSSKMQAEYRDLITMRDKAKAKLDA
mgnify:CR=1 FL=1